MGNIPRITIVTPSYNQGRYLSDTIESVLGQGYPNLEYMVMDGGSKDESVEVIKRYQKHLAFWCSEKDGGQAAAINRAFSMATGDILAWVNSDDYYLPGALRHAAEKLEADREQILLGNCFHFVEGSFRNDGSDVEGYHGKCDLKSFDYIKQPSTFWTKKLWDKVGPLESKWSFVFDWDWFIRAQKAGADYRTTSRYLSGYRLHAEHKSGSGGAPRQREIREIYEKHAGERIIRLYDVCKENHAFIRKVKRRAKHYKLTKLVKDITLLKLLYPKALEGTTSKEVDMMLDVVSS